MEPAFLPWDATVFTDTLTDRTPYRSATPRNHESLCLVTAGTLCYRRDGETYHIPAGQVGYIARGSVDWSGPAEDAASYIAVNFAFDRQAACPAPTLALPVCCGRTPERYRPLFQEALACFREKAPGYQAVCCGLILQLIGLLEKECAADSRTLTARRRLDPAMDYLFRRWNDPLLTVEALADACSLSGKQLRRLFRQVYGLPPLAYLQQYRLRQACILLENTARPVGAVAAVCGFSDVYGFSHCFRRHFGCTPSAYRSRADAAD